MAEVQGPVQTPRQPCRLLGKCRRPLQGECLGAAPVTWAEWSRAWSGGRGKEWVGGTLSSLMLSPMGAAGGRVHCHAGWMGSQGKPSRDGLRPLGTLETAFS